MAQAHTSVNKKSVRSEKICLHSRVHRWDGVCFLRLAVWHEGDHGDGVRGCLSGAGFERRGAPRGVRDRRAAPERAGAAASSVRATAIAGAAIHPIATAKNGISSVEPGRRLGVSQATAWTMNGRRAEPARTRKDAVRGCGLDRSPGPTAQDRASSGQGLPQAQDRTRRKAPSRCRNQHDRRWGLTAGPCSVRTGSGRKAARMASFKWVDATLGNVLKCACSCIGPTGVVRLRRDPLVAQCNQPKSLER